MMMTMSQPMLMGPMFARPDEVTDSTIGPLADRGIAREWALVLQSQSIAFIIHQVQPVRAMSDDGSLVEVEPGGLLLRVNPTDYERAIEAIDLYEEENENWPPPRVKDTPRHEASMAMGAAFFALLMFSIYVTGPSAGGSHWFAHGRADALKLFSEPWRMITALTLHADAQHVIGNAISGTIFGTMVARRIGPGGALLAILLSGILGNTINAIHHLPGGHWSIGASTAVFGAVGMLAALQLVIDFGRRERDEQHRRRWKVVDVLAPIVGGFALLGALGAGGTQELLPGIESVNNTDLWAHGYGFAAGIAIGILVGFVVRDKDRQPNKYIQISAGAAAVGVIGLGWTLAAIF